MMELLRHTIDLHHTVVQTTFPAGEHTVLKEVIVDTSYARPGSPAQERRVCYRLHLDARQLAALPASQLMHKTRTYPTLEALCDAYGIDPARAAVGLATRPRKQPTPPSDYRHKVREKGRFAPQHVRTHA